MKSFNLQLYAVTDPRLSTHIPIEEQVEAAIKGGVTFVQLREKNISFEEYVEKGKRVKAVCDRYDVPFVINDNVEVAKAVDSTGVHVGQSDMELTRAREILGESKVIGVSANTVEEALEAERNGADYIGIGAVFSTGTKTDVDTIGVDRLGQVANSVKIPSVAIGGINAGNAGLLKNTGIDGIAVVSALFGSDNIEEAAKELLHWKDSLKGQFLT